MLDFGQVAAVLACTILAGHTPAAAEETGEARVEGALHLTSELSLAEDTVSGASAPCLDAELNRHQELRPPETQDQ